MSDVRHHPWQDKVLYTCVPPDACMPLASQEFLGAYAVTSCSLPLLDSTTASVRALLELSPTGIDPIISAYVRM